VTDPKTRFPGGAAGVEFLIFGPAEGRYRSLAKVGRQLGKLLDLPPVSLPTLYRWVHKGVAGVRLDGLRVGGRWVVSDAALTRFVTEVTRARAGGRSGAALANRLNDRRAEQVSRQLDELGI
jgi:hypothetical protein